MRMRSGQSVKQNWHPLKSDTSAPHDAGVAEVTVHVIRCGSVPVCANCTGELQE